MGKQSQQTQLSNMLGGVDPSLLASMGLTGDLDPQMVEQVIQVGEVDGSGFVVPQLSAGFVASVIQHQSLWCKCSGLVRKPYVLDKWAPVWCLGLGGFSVLISDLFRS